MTRTIIAVTLIATLTQAVKLYSKESEHIVDNMPEPVQMMMEEAEQNMLVAPPQMMEREEQDSLVAPPMSETDPSMLFDGEHMMAKEDERHDDLTSMIEDATEEVFEDQLNDHHDDHTSHAGVDLTSHADVDADADCPKCGCGCCGGHGQDSHEHTYNDEVMALETASHLANIAEENHATNSDDTTNDIVAEIFDEIVDQIDDDPSITNIEDGEEVPQGLLEAEQEAEAQIEEATE